jgi:hypothetical protein
MALRRSKRVERRSANLGQFLLGSLADGEARIPQLLDEPVDALDQIARRFGGLCQARFLRVVRLAKRRRAYAAKGKRDRCNVPQYKKPGLHGNSRPKDRKVVQSGGDEPTIKDTRALAWLARVSAL